ncbi:MAG: orotidine-5'-phosphate decarboxylase [Ignavibacteria bacterium]
MNSLDKIIQRKKEIQSSLIIGLDTDINKIPEFFLRSSDNPIYDYNKLIIELTKELTLGYKLNIAFYELSGPTGYIAFEKTLELLTEEVITIADVKRGDIRNTNRMYAGYYFEKLNFDAVTVSPYMGVESLQPFFQVKGKLTYVLARTSNPGAEDFQTLKSNGKFLYELVIEKFIETGCDSVGFVVGANYPELINKLTTSYSNLSLLIPGIGAQGNDVEILTKSIGNPYCLVNVSRAIIFPVRETHNLDDLRNSIFSAAQFYKDSLPAFPTS